MVSRCSRKHDEKPARPTAVTHRLQPPDHDRRRRDAPASAPALQPPALSAVDAACRAAAAIRPQPDGCRSRTSGAGRDRRSPRPGAGRQQALLPAIADPGAGGKPRRHAPVYRRATAVVARPSQQDAAANPPPPPRPAGIAARQTELAAGGTDRQPPTPLARRSGDRRQPPYLPLRRADRPPDRLLGAGRQRRSRAGVPQRRIDRTQRHGARHGGGAARHTRLAHRGGGLPRPPHPHPDARAAHRRQKCTAQHRYRSATGRGQGAGQPYRRGGGARCADR